MSLTVAGKAEKGIIYHILGHQMRVTTIKKLLNGRNKVFLSCCPQCCTRPFHTKLQILESDFEKITLDKF